MTAKEIKALRNKLNMTQQEMADKIGVHRITVNRWEAKVEKPSRMALRNLKRLVKGGK